MKKFKTLSLLLICVLFVSILPAKASAAVKISKRKVTMYVGDATTLKITGTRKSVKWKSSKKSVATVSKRGKVTAKSEGTSIITAKVGKRKYKCKVTVKDKFNPDDALKNLECTYHEYDNNIVAIIKNNYKYTIKLHATVVFYSASDEMLDTRSDSNFCLGSGNTCLFYFYGPTATDYDEVGYDHYKIIYSCSESIATDISDQINITHNEARYKIMAEVKNTGKKKCDTAKVAILFFQDDNVVGYSDLLANVENPDSFDFLKFRFPRDKNYDLIPYDDYQIFIDHAYYYNR